MEQSGNSCNKTRDKLCRIHLARETHVRGKKEKKAAAKVEHELTLRPSPRTEETSLDSRENVLGTQIN